MANATRRASDRGVLLVLGVPPATVKDKNGTAITPTVIDNTKWQASASTTIGRGTDTTIWVSGQIAVGTAKLRIEVARNDEIDNPTLWQWASVLSTRGDKGVGSNTLVEHSISGTDLTSTFDGVSRQDIAFQTDSPHGVGNLRVIVEWQEAPNAADFLVVAADTTIGGK